MIEQVVNTLKSTGIEVHILIRPRPGNFTYSSGEFDCIIRDILAAKQAGADGVVVGVLDRCGNIDRERLDVLRSLSLGMMLTFHRAIDLVPDLASAVEEVVACGCDRILTSGQCSSGGSTEGIRKMKEIVRMAAGRVRVIAAAGINSQNVHNVVYGSEVDGIHAGSSVTCKTLGDVPECMDVKNPVSKSFKPESGVVGNEVDSLSTAQRSQVCSGLASGGDIEDINSWDCVDSVAVKELVDNANAAWEKRSQDTNCIADGISKSDTESIGKVDLVHVSSIGGEGSSNREYQSSVEVHLSHTSTLDALDESISAFEREDPTFKEEDPLSFSYVHVSPNPTVAPNDAFSGSAST